MQFGVTKEVLEVQQVPLVVVIKDLIEIASTHATCRSVEFTIQPSQSR